MNVAGIDIGGTNFRIGIIDDSGNAVKFEKVPVRTVFCTEDILGDLALKIREFCAGYDLAAVAVGFPATLDADRSKVLQAPNIAFMENLPVRDKLSAELGVPVFAERDVTYALCYDMAKYSIPEEGIVCGVYFGTGIGNAISINGLPLVGRHGTAGELGHIPAVGSTEACGCGNVGCLETIAGGKALVKLQEKHYPATPIGEIFARYAGDEELKRFIDLMAIAVATEVNILDPDCVLVGGGVLNGAGFPKEYLRERIMAHVRKPFPMNDLNLIFTEDERDKSVVGGAVYARKKLG